MINNSSINVTNNITSNITSNLTSNITDVIINNETFPAYPNATLTPGDIFPVNASTVCVSGYTTTVRDVPLTSKKRNICRI